jgi:hypothetical protein
MPLEVGGAALRQDLSTSSGRVAQALRLEAKGKTTEEKIADCGF